LGRPRYESVTHRAIEGTPRALTAHMRYFPGGRIADELGIVICPFTTGRET
jgi:hypothetical protein